MRPLFNSYLLSATIQKRSGDLESQVQSIPANTLLRAPEHDLAEALAEKFRLEVPIIDEAAIHIAKPIHTVQNDETVVISLPFHGDSHFFQVLPPGHPSPPPLGEIETAQLLLYLSPASFDPKAGDPQAFQHEFQSS